MILVHKPNLNLCLAITQLPLKWRKIVGQQGYSSLCLRRRAVVVEGLVVSEEKIEPEGTGTEVQK